MEERNVPPVVLVKTWLGLINSQESEEIRNHATKMLMQAFGDDIKAVASFCNRHGISMK
jgi:hypothetical protein